MDVNVRDVEEIVRFGHSMKGFLSDYLGVLRQVVQGAGTDRSNAENILRRIRNRVDSAESDLRSAQRMLDDAINRANNYPDEDHSDDIDYASALVEERQAVYERASQALEEAEAIVSKVRNTTERVIEEVNRSSNQIRDNGAEALHAIKNAAKKISEYI